MKKAIVLFATLLAANSAHAMHIYAEYNCKSAKVDLRYDGPGSNYAVGGYSNFYSKTEEKVLAYDNSSVEDQETLGSEISEQKVGALFSVVDSKIIGEEKTDTPDPKTCERGDYEHSEWNSIKKVKIEAISAEASIKLGLKAGEIVEMNCAETMDVPAGCDN